MVALVIAHVDLDAPGGVEEVREFYVTALGGVECTAPTPDDELDHEREQEQEHHHVLRLNVGESMLRLHTRAREDAASDADGGAAPSPLAGHIELWTTEDLKALCDRLAPHVNEAPTLNDGADMLVCTCPWGNRLLVRPAPGGDAFKVRGRLPGGHGTCAAMSRAVLHVPHGGPASVRAFFIGVLGSQCELRRAGTAEHGMDYVRHPLLP